MVLPLKHRLQPHECIGGCYVNTQRTSTPEFLCSGVKGGRLTSWWSSTIHTGSSLYSLFSGTLLMSAAASPNHRSSFSYQVNTVDSKYYFRYCDVFKYPLPKIGRTSLPVPASARPRPLPDYGSRERRSH